MRTCILCPMRFCTLTLIQCEKIWQYFNRLLYLCYLFCSCTCLWRPPPPPDNTLSNTSSRVFKHIVVYPGGAGAGVGGSITTPCLHHPTTTGVHILYAVWSGLDPHIIYTLDPLCASRILRYSGYGTHTWVHLWRSLYTLHCLGRCTNLRITTDFKLRLLRYIWFILTHLFNSRVRSRPTCYSGGKLTAWMINMTHHQVVINSLVYTFHPHKHSSSVSHRRGYQLLFTRISCVS